MNHRFIPAVAAPFLGLAIAGAAVQANAATTTQGFNGTTLPTGWVTNNESTAASTGNPWGVTTGITDSSTGAVIVGPYEGTGFAVANYTSVGSGTGTINNWLISPEFSTISNGDVFSFYTTTTPASSYPDRLQFRLSSAGAGVDVGTTVTGVGTFTTLLGSVNPTLAVGGYPESWTKVSYTISGLAAPVDGRVAFRYFVTSGGPDGANSNVIGVDAFSYTTAPTAAVPEPASWALMFGGLGAMSLLAKRRASKKN